MNAVFIYSARFPETAGSIVLQALIPARHLGAKALYFGGALDAASFLDQHMPDVLIFTKLYDENTLRLAVEAKRRGVAVIGVICDLHLTDQIGRANKQLSEIADELVVPTEYLASLLQKHYARPVGVLEEPIQFPRMEPKFSPADSELAILWCGSPNNHDTLGPGIQNLSRYRDRRITLIVVSGKMPPDWTALSKVSSSIKMIFLPWELMTQFDMMQLSDIVFLPSLESEEKRAKSHDRLVEAINAGRLAVAHPLPQYQELSEYCLCTQDYAGAIANALKNRPAMIERIRRGQDYIDGRFAAEVVAAKWQTLFNRIRPESL